MSTNDSSWKKYANYFFLTFHNNEIERAYQENVYRKTKFLIFTIVIYSLVFANTMIFYFLSNPIGYEAPLQTNSTQTSNSSQQNNTLTNSTKNGTTGNTTTSWRLKTTVQDNCYAYVSFFFATVAFL